MPETTDEHTEYANLYEELGQKYPETFYAHRERFIGSRFWTVMHELTPFAKKSRKLVDLGCNDGAYSIPYSLMGGTAFGIDISETLVRKASERAHGLMLACHFLRDEVDSLSLSDRVRDSFDVALFSEVLEHVANPDQALINIRTLLTQGGNLILTTPTPLFNDTRPSPEYFARVISGRRLLESCRLNTDILGKFGVSAFDYRHDGYYPRALKKYVEKVGFKCKKSYTIDYLRSFEETAATSTLGSQINSISSTPLMKSSIVRWLRTLGLEMELPIRSLPLLKLFGSTNVGIYSKI